jgi:hypothetical protein
MDDMLIECDECERVFCGPGLLRVVHRVGDRILCDDCVRASEAPPPSQTSSEWPTPARVRRSKKKKAPTA